jgi:predicted ester cyclase
MLTRYRYNDMSNIQYKTIAKSFVEEIFNARKTELAKTFVTPNIAYHSIDGKVSGLEEFKKWIGDDLSAFSNIQVTVLDVFGEQNKVALRWSMKATFGKDFAGYSASNRDVELEGVEILHFEGDKINEAWTIFDLSQLAK